MNFEEKTIATEEIFKGHVIRLRVDTVALPGGGQSTREIVEHPGGVAVLPVDDEGYVTLVRQYRKPLERVLLEAPAGKLTPGEDPLACGVRELREETGLCATDIVSLGYIIPTPGFASEIIHLYLARGLIQGEASPDEDELVNAVRYPFAQVEQMCLSGEISDAKTVAAVLRAKAVL